MINEEEETNPRLSVVDANGRFRILSEKCHDCVFNPASQRLDLDPAYFKNLVDGIRASNDYLWCHNTYAPLGPPGFQYAVCGGWDAAYGNESQALQVAKRLGIVAYVEPPEKEQLQ